MSGLELELLGRDLAICRLPGDAAVPGWSSEGVGLRALVRTPDELSILCDEGSVPAGVEASGGWRALRVAGKLDLSLTGVLIALLKPLEDAEIPTFAISTYDTDYVLVPADRLDAARSALAGAGHRLA